MRLKCSWFEYCLSKTDELKLVTWNNRDYLICNRHGQKENRKYEKRIVTQPTRNYEADGRDFDRIY